MYVPPLSVVAGALGLAVLYWLCTNRLRNRFSNARAVGFWPQTAFYAAIALTLLALATPLDEVSDKYLFSAHMVQHLLLTLGVAPLLLAGTPGWLFSACVSATRIGPFLRWARHPLVAFFGFNLIFSLAHVPPLYELTLASEPLHALEHIVFVLTAVLMWMPVLTPDPRLVEPYPPLGQVFYLFAQTLPASLVGALLSASGAAYPTYILAPRITSLSPLEDQQLGGLIMWVGGGLYFLIATGVVFFAWAAREEASSRRPGVSEGVLRSS